MNPGALSGSNRTPGTYSMMGRSSFGGGYSRASLGEIRILGWPDGQLGIASPGQAGGAKAVNTNPQAKVASIYFPDDTGSIVNVGAGQMVSLNGAPMMSAAYNTAGTIYNTASMTNNSAAFESNATIVNYGTQSISIPGYSTVAGGNLYVANGGTVTFGVSNFADINSNLAWAATAGGTFSVGTVYNMQARQSVVQSGVTITKRVGFRMEDTGTGGTITTQTGLEIPALSGGTTNIGINNQSSLNQQGAFIAVNNTITVTSNAGTANVTGYMQTFTNSSAAAMTITLTTTGATDGQKKMIRIYDFSAVAQSITWVNTENTSVTAPTTSNGSTTKPLYVAFMFNSAATNKWDCVGYA